MVFNSGNLAITYYPTARLGLARALLNLAAVHCLQLGLVAVDLDLIDLARAPIVAARFVGLAVKIS